MGKEVTFDYSKAAEFISAEEMANFKTTVMAAKDTLLGRSGAPGPDGPGGRSAEGVDCQPA